MTTSFVHVLQRVLAMGDGKMEIQYPVLDHCHQTP